MGLLFDDNKLWSQPTQDPHRTPDIGMSLRSPDAHRWHGYYGIFHSAQGFRPEPLVPIGVGPSIGHHELQ